ncbi:MAG: S41 family peptidase [Bdellovibrio sp.]
MFSTPRFFTFSLLTLAMGASLFLSRHYSDSSKLKSVEDYWTESGLGPAALEDLLQDSTCASSERYFLACANSILAVSSRFNLSFNTSGNLIPAKSDVATDVSTEKKQLQPWKDFFNAHPEQIFKLSFFNAWKELKQKYISPVQMAMMTGIGLNGFISVFRDPHTYFMPVAQFHEVISKTDSRSTSVGLILGFFNNIYYVRKVIDGSAAQRAGVKKGDKIISIDGNETANLLQARVSELLKGDENKFTTLIINRDGEKIKFELAHKLMTVATVSVRVIDGIKPVAVIGINKFSKGTCNKVKESLAIVKKANVRGLLLDLRDNPGGQMEEAACLTSLFVGSDKKIFEVRYLDPTKKVEEFFGEEQKAFDLPMAVLINGYSASASEIVAGALQDLNRAILVGEKTFGKGSFQEGQYWSQNKKIALFETKGFYFLPSGVSPQMHGIEPDIAAKFDNFPVARESDQFTNPLRAPSSESKPATKRISLSNCLEMEDSDAFEDNQIIKARNALFCSNKVARSGL